MAEHNVAAGPGATGHFDEKAPVAAPAPAGRKYEEDDEPDEVGFQSPSPVSLLVFCESCN